MHGNSTLQNNHLHTHTHGHIEFFIFSSVFFYFSHHHFPSKLYRKHGKTGKTRYMGTSKCASMSPIDAFVCALCGCVCVFDKPATASGLMVGGILSLHTLKPPSVVTNVREIVPIFLSISLTKTTTTTTTKTGRTACECAVIFLLQRILAKGERKE